jgi:hypothetical protein
MANLGNAVTPRLKDQRIITPRAQRRIAKWLRFVQGSAKGSRVAFYLPSKIGAREIPDINRRDLLQSTRNAFVMLFGGATEFHARGTYLAAGKFANELVTVCYAFCDSATSDRNGKQITQLANALAIEFQQWSLGVEISGTFYEFSPTEAYRQRYQRLKQKCLQGRAEKWGYLKWLEVQLDPGKPAVVVQ